MDWSTSALLNDSPLARRLPGQRTPPDPTIGQPNAADITYGWHSAPSSSSSSNSGDGSGGEQAGDGANAGSTRQLEAAQALRQRRRERRGARRGSTSSLASSSSEGSIASFNSAQAGPTEPDTTGRESADTSKGKESIPTGPTPHADIDAEGFICRICFDGPGSQDEGGETLGRLIAPCRCRGTMKFVHQACLTRWRATSMRQSSIVACDQCGSPYKFRKSKFVGLATNRLLILLVSCFMFLGMIWTVGFTAESIVRRWEDPAAEASSSGRKGASGAASNSQIWQTVFGEEDDAADDTYGGYGDDVYTYGYGYVTSFYWEPLSYFKLIKAAVKHVGSGRATRAVKKLVRSESRAVEDDITSDGKEMGWMSTLLDDWKYGPGGIWEGQRPQREGEVDVAEREGEAASRNDGKESEEASTPRERYDAKTASVVKPGETVARARKERKESADPEVAAVKTGWWDRLTLQFSLGFSLVGIFSFINLLLGVSFWGPFHLGNFGLGRSFARLTGGRRRGGGGGGGGSDGGTIASVILLFLVIIGILRALMAVISFTTYLSKRLLTRVEDYIVEYSGEEEQEREVEAPAQEGPVLVQ